MGYLAVGAIFKDEAPYLREWLLFHRLVGVDHFFLYDHGSTDDWRTIARPWMEAGLVTVTPWTGQGPKAQIDAYVDCIRRCIGSHRWLALIDCDEFLSAPLAVSLPAALDRYEHHPAIGVNWAMFGSGGHEVSPGPSVIENFRHRAARGFWFANQSTRVPDSDPVTYHPVSAHIKSVVRPNAVAVVHNAHCCAYTGGRPAVTENLRPIERLGDRPPSFSPEVSWDHLKINHYWSKSKAELRRKIARGTLIVEGRYDDKTAFIRDEHYSKVRDDGLWTQLRALCPDFLERLKDLDDVAV